MLLPLSLLPPWTSPFRLLRGVLPPSIFLTLSSGPLRRVRVLGAVQSVMVHHCRIGTRSVNYCVFRKRLHSKGTSWMFIINSKIIKSEKFCVTVHGLNRIEWVRNVVGIVERRRYMGRTSGPLPPSLYDLWNRFRCGPNSSSQPWIKIQSEEGLGNQNCNRVLTQEIEFYDHKLKTSSFTTIISELQVQVESVVVLKSRWLWVWRTVVLSLYWSPIPHLFLPTLFCRPPLSPYLSFTPGLIPTQNPVEETLESSWFSDFGSRHSVQSCRPTNRSGSYLFTGSRIHDRSGFV